jgi:hypothetical protein
LILVYSSFLLSFEAAAAAPTKSEVALDNSDAIDPAFFLASAMAASISFFFKKVFQEGIIQELGTLGLREHCPKQESQLESVVKGIQ